MKCALLLVAFAALPAGCGPCGPFSSASRTETATVTLSPSSPATTVGVEAIAGAQDCGHGCASCGEPRVVLTISGRIATTEEADPARPPVVRIHVRATSPLGEEATAPPEPVDVVVDPAAPSEAAFSLVVDHVCASPHGCIADYVLGIERLDPQPLGEVSVDVAADATYDSSVAGAVKVTLSPAGS